MAVCTSNIQNTTGELIKIGPLSLDSCHKKSHGLKEKKQKKTVSPLLHAKSTECTLSNELKLNH